MLLYYICLVQKIVCKQLFPKDNFIHELANMFYAKRNTEKYIKHMKEKSENDLSTKYEKDAFAKPTFQQLFFVWSFQQQRKKKKEMYFLQIYIETSDKTAWRKSMPQIPKWTFFFGPSLWITWCCRAITFKVWQILNWVYNFEIYNVKIEDILPLGGFK